MTISAKLREHRIGAEFFYLMTRAGVSSSRPYQSIVQIEEYRSMLMALVLSTLVAVFGVHLWVYQIGVIQQVDGGRLNAFTLVAKQSIRTLYLIDTANLVLHTDGRLRKRPSNGKFPMSRGKRRLFCATNLCRGLSGFAVTFPRF